MQRTHTYTSGGSRQGAARRGQRLRSAALRRRDILPLSLMAVGATAGMSTRGVAASAATTDAEQVRLFAAVTHPFRVLMYCGLHACPAQLQRASGASVLCPSERA